MKNPVSGAVVAQRWGYTGLSSNGPYYDNRYSPARYYPSGFHTGVDLAAPRGTHIRNMEHGIVVAAAWNGCEPNGSCWGYGGGYVAIVKHNAVPLYTSHAHMQRLFVHAGQPVHRGQLIGELDTQGYATGPHDHCSLWIKGLWYTVNRAYTLDPRAAIYGALADKPMLNPSSVRVPLGVHLRAGPGLGYSIVCANRKGTILPQFKIQRHAGAVPGYASRAWRLVWCGRWAWVFDPLCDVVKPLALDDEELLAMGAEASGDLRGAGPNEERTVHAPFMLGSYDVGSYPDAPPDPDDVPYRSRSRVAHLEGAEDAF